MKTMSDYHELYVNLIWVGFSRVCFEVGEGEAKITPTV